MNKLLVQITIPLQFDLAGAATNDFKAQDNTRWRGTFKGQPMKIIFSVLTLIKYLVPIPACMLTLVTLTYGQAISLSQPLTTKWSYPSDAFTSVAPAGSGETIYLPLSGGRLISLRAKDGDLLWSAEVGGEVSISPSLDSQSLYVASVAAVPAGGTDQERYTGILRALSRASGIALWVQTFSTPLQSVLTTDGQLFVSSTDGALYSLDKRTGELEWTAHFSHKLSSPISVSGTRLWFGTEDGYIISLDQKTGNTLRRYRTPAVVRSPIIVVEPLLFLGMDGGYVYSMSENGGDLVKLWRQRAGTGIQSVQSTPQGILITTQDNFVMLFTSQRGKRVWKKQMPARMISPPLLVEGGALFASVSEEACIALSLSDGRQINTLFIGKDNSPIAPPFSTNGMLFIPTRAGLLAFAASK